VGSIKKNAVYNILLAVSQVLLPLVTFPYISRILLPQGVGTYTFVDSYTQYFVLIAALGIPIYGMREIAKAKKSLVDRSQVFTELLSIHLLVSVLVSVLYIVSFLTLSPLKGHSQLFWIGSSLLLSNVFVIEWFFQGMEQFPFITLRTLCIRVLTVIAIFVFVKSSADTFLYYAINCASVFINAVINCLYARKFVKISFRGLSLKRHLTPLLYIFSTGLVTNVYTLLDSVVLGFLTNTVQVGFYTTAVKLSKILIMILVAFTTVLVPPLSLAYKEGRYTDAKILLSKSFNYVIFISVPLSIGIYVIAQPLILLFSGPDFLPAALSLKILSPTILIVGLSYVFGQQIINATGNERYFLISAMIGMVISVGLNLLLIPYIKQTGAAITNLTVEFAVMLLLMRSALQKVPFNPQWSNLVKAIISCLPFFLINYYIENISWSPFIQLIVIILFSGASYISVQHFIWKSDLLTELVTLLKKTSKGNER
jgi:O-antigen/teichoic acid export membrane protein